MDIVCHPSVQPHQGLCLLVSCISQGAAAEGINSGMLVEIPGPCLKQTALHEDGFLSSSGIVTLAGRAAYTTYFILTDLLSSARISSMGMVQKQARGEDWQGDLVKCLPFKEEDLNPIPSKDVKRWAWVTCVLQSQ